MPGVSAGKRLPVQNVNFIVNVLIGRHFFVVVRAVFYMGRILK